MFSSRSIERIAGALLVASIVAILGHIVALIPTGTPGFSTGSIHEILEFIAQSRGAVLTNMLFLLMYGFLVMLSALALYLAFRPHERTMALFGSFGLAVHGLFVVLFNILFLVLMESAQEFAVTSGAEADRVATVASVLLVFLFRVQGSAWIFLGLGLVPLGILIAWSGAVSRWVGGLGVVTGILGFFGGLVVLYQVALGGLASLMGIAFFSPFVFILILGVWLLVRETREAIAGTLQRGGTNHVLQPCANP